MLRLARGALFLAVVALALAAVIAAARIRGMPVAALATRAPRVTALMLQREREARRDGRSVRIDQRWVSYFAVSPVLRRAILIAEDDKFYTHDGLDWDEIQASARRNLEARKVVRGGSTITQQLAKNLFLGDQRTLTRKLEEAFLAIRLEHVLSKRRIFELYLNLIEWGDGVFGAEAAARHYFGVPASRLSERQAILLAAVIINPRRFSVLRPNARIERRVRMIASRMRSRGYLDEATYAAVIGRPAPAPARSPLDWLLGRGDTAAGPATAPPPAPAAAAPESVATMTAPADSLR